MKKYHFCIIFSIGILSGCFFGAPKHSIDLKDVKADGSEPRLEREFKYSFNEKTFQNHNVEVLTNGINKALREFIKSADQWKAPEITGSHYYTDNDVEDFVYFDIYFDTDDELCYQNSISYRLRERFKNLKDYKEHVNDQKNKKNWPLRIEFQAKVGRQELGEGFSNSYESRFEFREESEPFSSSNPPPPQPWNLDEFIVYFQSGRFKDYYMWPAKTIVDYLMPGRTDKTKLYFKPKLILVTQRYRQHLNIQSDWGSGPNPEQAFIITVDAAQVYEADEYLKYMRQKKYRMDLNEPKARGEFTEIEIEFERNVSEKLDRQITAATQQENAKKLEKLQLAQDAFLADQKKIMAIIQKYFKEEKIDVSPGNKSKYLKAYELIR